MKYLYLLALCCLLLTVYLLIPMISPSLLNPVTVFGLIASGACLSAVTGKRFRLTLPRYSFNLGQAFVGGVLMGIGLGLAKLPELGNVLVMVSGVFYWSSFAMPQGFVYLAGMLLGGGIAAGLQKLLYPRLKFTVLTETKTLEAGTRYLLVILVIFTAIGALYGLSRSGWPIGLVAVSLALTIGFLLERNRLCMALLMKEIYFTKAHETLHKLLGVIIFLTIGWRFLSIGGPARQALTWSTLPGSFLMGFGFMLAEGCFMGSLWKVGQGSVVSLTAIVGLFLGGEISKLDLRFLQATPVVTSGSGWEAFGVKLGVAFFLVIWMGSYFIERPRDIVKVGPRVVWLMSECSLAGMLVVLLMAPHFTLPIVAKLAGLLILYLGIGLYAWARLSLGSNWGESIILRKGHCIVTSGPYRYLKHPIYTAVVIGLTGLAIIYGNLWAQLWTLLIVLPLLKCRAGTEEKLLYELPGAKEYFSRH